MRTFSQEKKDELLKILQEIPDEKFIFDHIYDWEWGCEHCLIGALAEHYISDLLTGENLEDIIAHKYLPKGLGIIFEELSKHTELPVPLLHFLYNLHWQYENLGGWMKDDIDQWDSGEYTTPKEAAIMIIKALPVDMYFRELDPFTEIGETDKLFARYKDFTGK